MGYYSQLCESMSKTFKSEVIRITRKELNQSIHTSYPATIVDVSNLTSNQTITVQPLIHIEYEDGQLVRLPIIYDVPVLFPAGDECLMSFPLKVGGVVGLVFVKNSLEEFLESNDPTFYTPVDRRSFSLSDCFALPSLFTKRDNLSPHPDNLEIKFKDILFSLRPDGTVVLTNGSSTIEMNGSTVNISNSSGYMNLLSSGVIQANGAQITTDGDFVTAAGISLNGHKHPPGSLLDAESRPLTGETDQPT